MKWVFLVLALVWSGSAIAQPKQVVASCGTQTLVVGDSNNGYIDATGKECGSGGGGGGGAVTIADGADVTLGSKADAKSTATDTTPITIMSVLKQVSASVQAAAASLAGTLTVATHAVTQSGTWAVNLAATTSGGCAPYHLSGGTAASNNSTNIKSSQGNLCSIAVFNDGTGSATVVNYLKIYDSASAPTCSSATNLKHVMPIPVDAMVRGVIWSVALNESYANGIGFCVVSTGADTGNGNAQTGIYVEASYK